MVPSKIKSKTRLNPPTLKWDEGNAEHASEQNTVQEPARCSFERTPTGEVEERRCGAGRAREEAVWGGESKRRGGVLWRVAEVEEVRCGG